MTSMPIKLPGHDFRVECEAKKNTPAWDSTIVSIFDGGRLIGIYERMHFGWGDSTFFPFERGRQWYALFSADYTRTSLMTLPDCSDIGGESPVDPGFCPVEFYVPRYRVWTQAETGYAWYEFDNEDDRSGRSGTEDPSIVASAWTFLDIGFVAGCIWGDDTSWKLEVLDLRRAAEGVVTRDARFGHVELAHKSSLKDTVDLGHWRPDAPLIRIVRQEMRNLSTGALIDPYDL